MSLLTDLVIAVAPILVVATASAIYLNRRSLNQLYQRLFGLDDDPADDGYIQEMDRTMNEIHENVEELNHRRITDIEERLDDLDEKTTDIQMHLRGRGTDGGED